MSKIIYVGHYGESDRPRVSSPAANTMMNYVFDAINEAGYDFVAFSPAQLENGEASEKEEVTISQKRKIIFMPSFKRYSKKNIPMRFVQKLRREKCLFKELNNLINDEDTIIAYHSLSLIKPILKLRKKKKINLILQVCEIYADVIEDKKIREKELAFIDTADKYIFSSKLLEEKINLNKKDFVLCYGTYNAEKILSQPLEDRKTHILYAGILDPRKGSGNAVFASQYLNENYHIHVLGFGSESEKTKFFEILNSISKDTKCKVTYDGCLYGEEFKAFLQKCHIGLCPQDPSASFTSTSFPSKILAYLANGLRVVSVRIPAIETSPVADCISFYDEQSPESIAKAIMSIDLNSNFNGREVIKKLNDEFIENIKELIK